MADFLLEKEYFKSNQIVAGTDEAGRGPLAGPVVAAAVIFDSFDDSLLKINDSKKLSAKVREELFELIILKSAAYSIEIIDHIMIDKINILNASMLAMKNAIGNLKITPDISFIDGNRFIYKEINHRTIIKGDEKSISIAAASILAKVTRDKIMVDEAVKYPYFRFEKNKGYPTKEHITAIGNHGVCDIHRRTFLKKIGQRLNNEIDYTIF